MKMIKMLVVMFALIGSHVYADSNETSKEPDQKNTETSVSEVEMLRARVKVLEKQLVEKETLVEEAKSESKIATQIYQDLSDEFGLVFDQNFEYVVLVDKLTREIGVLNKKLLGFRGD